MELIQEHVSALAEKLGTKPEVIQSFLTSAEASEEVKPFAESLPKLHVFTDDVFTARLGNERKQAGDQKLGETFEMVEKRIKKETGIEQLAGESALDYQVRAFREKFSKTTDSEELQRVRDEATAAKQLLATKNTEFETYKAGVEKEKAKGKVAADLTGAIGTIDLADPAQADYVGFKFNEKYSSKVTADGIEYTDRATGAVQRNPATAGLATAADLLKTFAPTIPGVSFKKPSTKPGSGFDSSRQNLNDGAANGFDFSQYGSKEDFAKDLNKQGISSGSKRGSELYDAFVKARPDLK